MYQELGPPEKHLAWIQIVDGGRQLSMNNIRGFLPSRISQAEARDDPRSRVGQPSAASLPSPPPPPSPPSPPAPLSQFLVNLHVDCRSFYLSRHGQSEYNVLGKLGGNPPLSPAGQEYARRPAQPLQLSRWHATRAAALSLSLSRTPPL